MIVNEYLEYLLQYLLQCVQYMRHYQRLYYHFSWSAHYVCPFSPSISPQHLSHFFRHQASKVIIET